MGATTDCGAWWWRTPLILSCLIALGCAIGSCEISNISADFMLHGVGHAGCGWPEVVSPAESGRTVRMEDCSGTVWDGLGTSPAALIEARR